MLRYTPLDVAAYKTLELCGSIVTALDENFEKSIHSMSGTGVEGFQLAPPSVLLNITAGRRDSFLGQ
jgi:hypothetical protein